MDQDEIADRDRLIFDLARATGQTPEVVRLTHPPVHRGAGDEHRTRYLTRLSSPTDVPFLCEGCTRPYTSHAAAKACMDEHA